MRVISLSKELLGLLYKKDGLIAYEIVRHATYLAKGHLGAQHRDNTLSEARFEFRWTYRFDLGLAPSTSR